MNNDSPKFAFILGRERDLCLAELRAVFKRFDFCFSISSLYDNVAIINIDGKSESDVAGLMETLGGTVKIFRIFQNSEIGIQNLAFKGIIVDYMRSNLKADGKFNYGISSYSRAFNRSSANNLGLSIKKELKKEFSLRFVELRDGQEVSSILSLKSKFVNEGFEFAIFESGEIGILIALSNAEEWGNRDYDKPAGDKRSGMLPPKLARAMLNIALGSLSKVSEVPQDKVLVLDPFCGSGNIVLEAMMLGLDVFASDNSERAVKDSQENVDWLSQNTGFRSQNSVINIFQADATSIDFKKLLLSANCQQSTIVVTEPYLGEPKKFKPSLKAAQGEYVKIKELYLNFFRNLQLAHLPTCSLAIVFPLIETADGKRFSLYRECVDEIKKIGYTIPQSPLIYGRDYQVVKREIALLTIAEY